MTCILYITSKLVNLQFIGWLYVSWLEIGLAFVQFDSEKKKKTISFSVRDSENTIVGFFIELLYSAWPFHDREVQQEEASARRMLRLFVWKQSMQSHKKDSHLK